MDLCTLLHLPRSTNSNDRDMWVSQKSTTSSVKLLQKPNAEALQRFRKASFDWNTTGLCSSTPAFQHLYDFFLIEIESEICNFVHETTIYVCDTFIELAMTGLETDPYRMLQWFTHNGMKANLSKLQVMLGTKYQNALNSINAMHIWVHCSIRSRVEYMVCTCANTNLAIILSLKLIE